MTGLAAELETLGDPDIARVLEEIPVRSFVLDSEGVIRWQSPSTRSEIGDWSGRNWKGIVAEAQHERVSAKLERLLGAGEPVEFTVDVVELDGLVHRREVSAAPLRGGRSVVGLFGVVSPDRVHPREPGMAKRLGLTERRLEILTLLAEGKSTVQIAEELYLSTTTVRNHVARLLSSLGVHTRVQAVIVASQSGLIRLGPKRKPEAP